MNRGAIIADVVVAVMAAACLIFGWGEDGLLHKVALIWGGMCAGYIVTIYLNQGEEE
jgi:hypothetical protein